MVSWIEWGECDDTKFEVYSNRKDRDVALEKECKIMYESCCATNDEVKVILTADNSKTFKERLSNNEQVCMQLLDSGHYVSFDTHEEPKMQCQPGELVYLLVQCHENDDEVENAYAFPDNEELESYWADELLEMIQSASINTDVDLESASIDTLQEILDGANANDCYYRRVITVAR